MDEAEPPLTETWWTVLLADGTTVPVSVAPGEDECAWEAEIAPTEDAAGSTGAAETPLAAVAAALDEEGPAAVGAWQDNTPRPLGSLMGYIDLATTLAELDPLMVQPRDGYDHHDTLCRFCLIGEYNNPVKAKHTAAWKLPRHADDCLWVLAMELCGKGEAARAAWIGTPSYQGKQP